MEVAYHDNLSFRQALSHNKMSVNIFDIILERVSRNNITIGGVFL